MKAHALFSLLLSTAVLSPPLLGQEAATDPVGFVSVTVPAQSDAVLAVPLYRAPEFRGIIQSISGNTLTVAGTPNWTGSQFIQSLPGQPKTYAALIASGTKEGLIAKVTANGTNTLTLQFDAGDDLTGVKTEAANPGEADQLDILPYWTPSALFSSNPPPGTQLYGFSSNAAGVNLAPGQILGFGGTIWEDDLTGDDASNQPLVFGASYLVRNNSASALPISIVGAVPMSSHRIKLYTRASGTDQDIRFGFISPVPEPLVSLNIPAVAGDVIYGFNNNASGINKAPTQILAFDGTQWVDDLTGDPVAPSFNLQPGFGYLYRKYRTGSPTSVTWQKLQGYLE